MFPSADDIPAAIAFVLPGFLTLALLASLRGPRKRTQMEWLAWSLALSVLTFWLVSPLTGGKAPTLTDPAPLMAQFVAATLLAAVIHAIQKLPKIGTWLAELGSMTEPKVWNGLIEPRQWVQVKLKSGELLYGEVSQCSNDPNEERLELYLEQVQSLADDETWLDLKTTRGIYIPGDEIRWVQILT